MAPILLHVGLHKTGTTWLQRQVFEAKAAAGEIAYEGDTRKIYGTFIVPRSDRFDPQAARAAFAPLMDSGPSGERPVVISGENLAGRPFHAEHQQEVVAGRLARSFPEAHVLLTIREQASVIQSMYGQYLRFGQTSSLEDFLAETDPASGFRPVLDRAFYDYDALLTRYEAWFGPGRVTILPLEAMLKAPDAALGRLWAAMGVQLAPVGERGDRSENPALSVWGYRALRFFNRFASADSRHLHRGGWFNPNGLAQRVSNLTPKGVQARLKAAERARIRAALGQSYAASNRALAARLGIDLGALGYVT